MEAIEFGECIILGWGLCCGMEKVMGSGGMGRWGGGGSRDVRGNEGLTRMQIGLLEPKYNVQKMREREEAVSGWTRHDVAAVVTEGR